MNSVNEFIKLLRVKSVKLKGDMVIVFSNKVQYWNVIFTKCQQIFRISKILIFSIHLSNSGDYKK